VNAAEHDERAGRSSARSDVMTTEGVTRVDADSDDIPTVNA
jgi:hypothetical protein